VGGRVLVVVDVEIGIVDENEVIMLGFVLLLQSMKVCSSQHFHWHLIGLTSIQDCHPTLKFHTHYSSNLSPKVLDLV